MLTKRIEAFMARLEREDVCLHGFILSVGGAEKAAAYYAPFREGQPHRMYSVSKTMTALGIGILADEGKISLDDHIADYFPDYLPETPDPRLIRLTIRDMLRMATCHRATTYREGADTNWARTFFEKPATHEPGTVFHYDTSCSQVLAALVERLTGMSTLDFLEARVFSRIGASDEKRWLTDPSGVCQGGTGLCMSLRDLHQTALTIMRGGCGVLPGWFVEEMSRCHISTILQTNEEERYGYGWQCWRTRAGYALYGMGGQLAVCCPEKDALLSTIADTRLDPMGVQRIYNAFFEEIYPFLGAEDMAPCRWDKQVAALPILADGAPHPGVYAFEAGNLLALHSVELAENTLWIDNAHGRYPLRFGLGENVQDVFPGFPQAPTLCSGSWLDRDTLRIRCYIIGDAPCGIDMLLAFRDGSVTIRARRSTDPVTAGFDGVATGALK